ncbi:hypothetical protein DFH09DRAFT_1076596 [Mycena vulgaris]|nr:hypothetical protein DFH09DRAFT_1076596 [Mycena vulgaris]
MSSLSDLLAVWPVYLQQTLLEIHLYTALFFLTLYAMIFKREMHKNNLWIFLSIVLMYTLSTVHVACCWLLIKNAFVDHTDTPEFTAVYLVEPPLWLTVFSAVVLTVNTLAADCVLLVDSALAHYLHLGRSSIAEQAAYVINPNLDRNSFIDFVTPYFSLSLATTCLVTILIILRIINMTEPSTRRAMGYGRVVQMVVESAMLYSVTLIIFLPQLVTESLNDGYAQAVVAQMTGIAPTLIVARATFGLARLDETWQGRVTFMESSRSTLPRANISLSRIHRFDSPANTDSSISFGEDSVELWANQSRKSKIAQNGNFLIHAFGTANCCK